MTSSSSKKPATTPLTRALETIKSLRAQLDEQSGHQPLAVIGVGMRFPGGIHDLDSYWDVLQGGTDLIRERPASRMEPFADEWATLPRRGSFLDEVLDFDAGFFGISPREARAIDPQHRLLLEVAVEALEDAALPPARLGDAKVGTYVGITGRHDYWDWLNGEMDAHWTTGNGHSFAAGRIAYTMGFTGPAVAIDAACASSLVSVHQASQALRRGECDVALAGGVNLVVSPGSTRVISQTGALAPDGLCKTFDARANGYVRGEGCGFVVLKRLDHARRDGDRVHAVIQGSAINQDGRSSGFTAPNVLSQIALIETALQDAGLTPDDIGLIEAHGTGTSLGDPIEVDALVAALRPNGGSAPLHIGSVKTNIGHLEAASGIAGLIKSILCLQRRTVPPLVHFQTLNPRIDVDGTGLVFSNTERQWDTDESGSYVGISSFGIVGTNAHVIVGAADADFDEARTGQDTASPATVQGFDISAKSQAALRELAGLYAARLATLGDEEYPAFAYSATSRAQYTVRAHVDAAGKDAAVAALTALANGDASSAVTLTEAAAEGRDAAGRPELPRRVTTLPHYPWQRRRHAPEAVSAPSPAAAPRQEPPETEAAPEPGPAVLYGLDWQPVALPETTGGRDVVLAGDDPELLELLLDEARARGLRGAVLGPVEPSADTGFDTGDLPADDTAWGSFWASRADTGPTALVLAMKATQLPASLDEPVDFGARSGALCAAVTTAVRTLHSAGHGGRAFAVTRGARQISGQDRPVAGDHGLLQGLAPVLGLEFNDSWGGVVDLPATPLPDDAGALWRLVCADSDEDLSAVRDGEVLAGRLRTAPADFTPVLPVTDDATYLITGGLGGIGRAMATDLVRRGARHLLLLGRTRPADLGEAATALLDEVREAGAEAVYLSADCDSLAALTEACQVLDGMPAVRGIVHGAGTLPEALLTDAGPEDFEAGLRGKFTGAWWLHLLSRDWPLDFFVQTSSASALWGNEGRGAYAAANGGIDTLAEHRLALGLKATTIAYGSWGLDGMADADKRRDLARMGIVEMTAAEGCATLAAAAPGPGALLVACPMDWQRFTEVMSTVRRRPLFDALLADGTAETAARQDGTTGTADAPAAGLPDEEVPPARAEVLAAPESARPAVAQGHTARVMAATLGHDDASDIPPDTGFFDVGLDSIMAVDLARDLSLAFGVRIKVADIFNHPTITELSQYIAERVADPAAATPAPARRRTPVTAAPAPAGTVPAPAPAGTPDEARVQEPVAIVGMAGRFPGADSVDELWELLREGRDTVGRVPADRWSSADLHDTDPLKSGKITSDQGGFLSDIARFDAAFFGVPAREAESLDPQQRLLLEASWHALEDGGIDPKSLKGTRTGVFVGITNSDYARLLEGAGLEGLDAYFVSGTALNAAAGRIAYTLGLNGPTMAVDTACSSSLSAVHLAVQSLRRHESDQVLAGGVNLITAPSCSVAVSRAHMLSPDGRCKTFSADANGFVRAEGCGVLVLKRLSDARRDGDRVLAVIHGSAVNQDGASSGLTVPSGTAQEAVIAAAIADAGVAPEDISYLEAHGTGTSLGDPIELNAAWSVLGQDRKSGNPLHIGSIKSNIGHCESASGIAGIFKTVLALRNGKLPASLHCDTLNPHVPWDDMNLRVVDALTPWRVRDGQRLAGVSSFGFSGTNAHVVLGEAPAPDLPPVLPEEGPLLMALSAPDAAGFERVARAWQDRAATVTDYAGTAALATTSGAGRAHFPLRRALFAETGAALLEQLSGVTGAPERAPGRPRVAFLFSGAGSQYFGMGQELYETEPVFRETIDDCGRVLLPLIGLELRDLMFYGADAELIDQIQYTQPATVAIELALAELWKSWGVVPSVVTGHSVGEIAAAVVAGVIDRETGLTLVAHRARLMSGTGRGSMLSLAASLDRVTGWIAGTACDVAAVNGPESVVVAGVPEDVAVVAERARAEDVKARELVISSAAHSRLIEPMVPELAAVVSAMEFRAPTVPIVSNLTGKVAAADEYGTDYWPRHVRRPVRFYEGAQELHRVGADFFLELGPDQTLINMVTAAGIAPAGGAVASLQRGNAERGSLLTAAAALYEQGQDLVWKQVQSATGGARAEAPGYPFAETRYWTKVTPARPAAVEAAPATRQRRHWGEELSSPALTGRVFAFERTAEYPLYLNDHRIEETVLTPASSHLATILSALAGQGRPLAIEDWVCPRPLIIQDGEHYDAQIIVDDGAAVPTVTLHSLTDPATGRWEKHLSGRLVDPGTVRQPAAPDTAAFIAAADRHIGRDAFYTYFRELGYTLGPSFRWIEDVWVKGDEALVRYTEQEVPDSLDDYELYPGLIDSFFQIIAAFMVDDEVHRAASLAIPFSASALSFPGRPERGGELWAHVRALQTQPLPNGRMRVETSDLHMFNGNGDSVAVVDGFRVRNARRAALRQSLRGGEPNAYELSLIADPRFDGQGRPGREIAVLGADTPLGATITEALTALGHTAAARTPDGLGAPGVDAVVDARFAGGTDASDALQASLALAGTLTAAPRTVPYVVLGEAGAASAGPREALWGMLAALEAEDAERRLLRITLDDGWTPEGLAGTLTLALDQDVPETRLVLNGSGTRIARLTAVPSVPDTPEWRGSVLVTGGLGALGLSVARMLAQQGAPAIALMGRSAPDAAAQQVIDELTAKGTAVRVVPGDVTDAADCAAAVAAASQDAPLCAVFHLAGATSDHAFDRLDAADYEKVFAAKARGAENLARATRTLGLDAFVLFSSAASLLGSAGQVNYGAANGFLNGLAESLRGSGTPATSIEWGPWVPAAKGGMAAAAEVERAAERLGIGRLTDESAEVLLSLALTGDKTRMLAAEVNATAYATALRGHPRAELVTELVTDSQPAQAAVPGPAGPPQDAPAERARGWLRDLLGELSAEERDDRLRDILRDLVTQTLGDPDVVFDDSLGFEDAGVDSIMALDLSDLLGHALATEISATVAIDYPNVGELAHFVMEHTLSDDPAEATVPPARSTSGTSVQDLTDEQVIKALQSDLTVEL
ncbi:SDR family NAD(P)-dependent oxidoreductase [Streptomyces sp. NPDC016845]|uniref:SDR family NAD(P)-dependent oxidoreductase n=1 Tax=Streptomyces sp. NPDC016845 TaxID=3364972 RepID=UPI0037953595